MTALGDVLTLAVELLLGVLGVAGLAGLPRNTDRPQANRQLLQHLEAWKEKQPK